MKLTVRSKRVQAFAVLLICLAFAHACHTFLLICLAFGSRLSFASVDMSCVCSRLLFDAQRQTERLAECSVPIPPWVGIAISAFSMAVRLSDLVDSLRACAFLYGDPDGERRRRGNAGDGERSRRRSVSAFLRDRIGFAMFSAGSTLGHNAEAALRPPPQTCAKETRLPGLSSCDSRCGCGLHGGA